MQKTAPLTQVRIKNFTRLRSGHGHIYLENPYQQTYQKGACAGNDSHGTISITINKKHYRANRLAWLYMTGEWPTNDIKAVNGLPDDVRWANLKLGTRKRT